MEALDSVDIEAFLSSEHLELPGLEGLRLEGLGLEGLGLGQLQTVQWGQAPGLQGPVLAGAPAGPLFGSSLPASQLPGFVATPQAVSQGSGDAWGDMQAPSSPGTASSWLPAAPGQAQAWCVPPVGSMAQAAQQQEPQRRRGRGRQPKNSEFLTEKQLRVREANKRFEEKRKAQMREAEQNLDTLNAELRRERAQHQSAQRTGRMYQQMLGYKDVVLSTLQLAHQFDPPPSLSIPPEMLEIIRRERVVEGFGAKALTRYSPGGWTLHLDENGAVKEPPPFEVVAKDWADIVAGLRAVLREARVGGGGGGGGGALSSISTHGAAGQPGLQQQQQAGPARSSTPGEFVELLGSGSGSLAGLSSSSSAEWGDGSGPFVNASSVSTQWQVPSGVLPRAASGGSSSGEAPALPAGMGAAAAAKPEAAAGPDCMQPSGRQAPEGAKSWQDEVLELEFDCGGRKQINWEEIDKGLELQDGPLLYRFSGPQLREILALMKRSGLIAWQQAILFPDNANKLVALRLDTCKDEQEGLPRWQRVLRELRLRPAQLEALAALHRKFMESVQPGLAQRKEALQRLRELHDVGMGESQLDITRQSLELNKWNSALTRSVHAFNAAFGEMASGLFCLLDFPLQEAKMVVLSWPWYPAVHLLGVAAAMELGLDMEIYTSFSKLYEEEVGTGSAGKGGVTGEGGSSGGGSEAATA